MINLEPIPKKIQKRLFEKMRALGRQSNSTTGQSIDTDALTHEKMASRTTFIRMTSGQINPVTLMGGLLKEDGGIRVGYDDIYGPRGYKKSFSTDDERTDFYDDLFIKDDEDNDTIFVNNSDVRPMPGIKSADIQFKGGLKALREATINWTCWGFEDLNELSPHFLAHGKTVMLQWGWVYDDTSFRNIPEFLSTDYLGDKVISEDAFNNYKNQVIDGKGDFDMMTGIVKNFEYTTREDGAFDCTTTLTSVGVNLIGNPEPNEESLSKHLTYNLSLNDNNEEIAKKLINATLNTEYDESRLGDIEKSKLININTNVSLKLFLKKIDEYIRKELIDAKTKPSKVPVHRDNEHGDRYVTISPNKYVLDSVNTGKIGGPLENHSIEDCWVSWGWFEDNILSKFTSQVNSSGNLINSFRSIESILTKNDEDSGKYESVRIKNHKYLQTIDMKNYILPGQFEPHQLKTYSPPKDTQGEPIQVSGDSEIVKKISSLVNDTSNFESFTALNEIEKVEFIDENLIASALGKKMGIGEIPKDPDSAKLYKNHMVKKLNQYENEVDKAKNLTMDEARKKGYTSFKPGFKERRFGYLRNMLINTKVIKKAFGVSDKSEEFTVEALTIEEAMNNLFSILNQPINFWNFKLTTDSVDTERVKIIDEETTAFDFRKSVSSQRSRVDSNGELFTENKPNEAGVFFFPIWRLDSIVKRQNVTAKVPDAMALTAMYGSNLDQVKEFSNVGNAYEDTGAVLAGGLYNSHQDLRNEGLTTAIKSGTIENTEWQNIGSANHIDNLRLVKKGPDDVLTYIKQNANLLQTTYTQRLEDVKEKVGAATILQDQAKKDAEFAKRFDPSKPPPLFENLEDEEIYNLLKNMEKLASNSLLDRAFSKTDLDDFKELFASKYEKTSGKMKSRFIESIKYLTSGNRGEVKTRESSVLIPLDVELDVDGTGGIFPGNSFHSTYLPSNYKNKTVFQAFDVSHKVDGSGWTTTITGKMRSTINNVFTKGKSFDDLENDVFKNYTKKVIATADKQKDDAIQEFKKRNKATPTVERK